MAEEMAVLVVVDEIDKAEYYRTLMEDHDIPVEISDEEDAKEGRKTVLVPEDMLEEAKYILRQADTFTEDAQSEFNSFDDEDEDDEDEFSDFSPLEDDDVLELDDDEDVLGLDDDEDDDSYGSYGGYGGYGADEEDNYY